MIAASQLRAGMAIRYEGQSYRVLAGDYHPGQGKMGGVNHVRLKNLSTGTTWEHSFRAELKIEEIPIQRQTLEFLYADAGTCFFMNPETYEQLEISSTIIGEEAKFLDQGMRLPLEFVDGRPVNIVFPDVIEMTIADTSPPLHGQQENTWKLARLSNGVKIMVPPFIKTGDAIRLNIAERKYMDRA